MIWGLETTLETFARDHLERLLLPLDDGKSVRGPELVAVVLAGNIFAATFRALLIPWLVGGPVVAKLAHRGAEMGAILAELVASIAPEAKATLTALSFPGGSLRHEETLFRAADVISVYGDDATVRAVRNLCPAHARVMGHGHGVSVAWLSETTVDRLEVADVEHWAEALTLDVAAYDQRGCLSPQAVLVEAPPRDPKVVALAEALFFALEERQKTHPIGPRDAKARTVAGRWREVSRALGTLWEADSHAISIESELRGSPAARHLALVPMADRNQIVTTLRRLGPHLKQVGVVPDEPDAHALVEALLPKTAPELVGLGQMQTPPVDAYADGRPPLEGLLTYRSQPPGDIETVRPVPIEVTKRRETRD